MQANSKIRRCIRGPGCGLVLIGIFASFLASSRPVLAELLLSVKAKTGGFDLVISNPTSNAVELQRVVVGSAFKLVNFAPRILASKESFGIDLKPSTEQFLGGEGSVVTVYTVNQQPKRMTINLPAPRLSVDVAAVKFGRVWIGQRLERIVLVRGTFDDVSCSDDSVSVAKLEGGKVQVSLFATAPGKVRSYLKIKAADVVYKLPVVADVLPMLEVIPHSIALGRLESDREGSAEIVVAQGQYIADTKLPPDTSLLVKVVPNSGRLDLKVTAKEIGKDIDEVVELRTNRGATFSVRVTGIAG